MRKMILLAVLALCGFAFADTTVVADNLIAARVDTVKEHVDYPVWRYSSDSAFKKLDVFIIRVLWKRQSGATVADTILRWRPTNNAVTTDSVNAFVKFNTVK